MLLQGRNITMIRGDSETLSISCKKDGKSYIERGDTLYLTVKLNSKTEDILLQKMVKHFRKGVALIEIEPGDTKELDYGDYVYDIQLSKANGVVKTIVPCAKFTIDCEVTYE